MAEHTVAGMMRHRVEMSIVVDVVETGIAYLFLTLLHRIVTVKRSQEKHGDEHCHEYPCHSLSLIAVPHRLLSIAIL